MIRNRNTYTILIYIREDKTDTGSASRNVMNLLEESELHCTKDTVYLLIIGTVHRHYIVNYITRKQMCVEL